MKLFKITNYESACSGHGYTTWRGVYLLGIKLIAYNFSKPPCREARSHFLINL